MTIIASTLGTATEQGHSLWASMGFAPAAELTARPGVIAGLALTKTNGMSFAIGTGRGGVQYTTLADGGCVPFAVTVAEAGTFAAGDAVKDRIDSVIATISNHAVIIQVLTGDLPSSGSPIAKALPADSIRLWDVLIPAGTSVGSGGWNTANATDRRDWAGIGSDSGDIKYSARATAPNGWLIAAGQIVSRTIYPALFAAIGTTFGAGDGSTTFGLPDLRGRVPAGVKTGDTNFGTLGQQSGEATHQLTTAELASHNHTYGWGTAVVSPSGATSVMIPAGFNNTIATSTTGSNTAHNNVQPSLALTPLIKL